MPQIEVFEPTLITFQAGGNDLVNGISADVYRSNVAAVLDAATGSGARVIVLAQNEWFRAPSGQGYIEPQARDEFDSILIEEAQARGAEFVDMRPIYRQQADENLWVEDGIHPTPEAYETWATELASAVPALGPPRAARFRSSAGVPVAWAGCRRRRPSCHGSPWPTRP